MNKQVYLAGILAAFLLAGAGTRVMSAFAAGDEDRVEDRATNRADQGREDGEDDNSAAIGGLSGLILYGAIAAVLGTIGYTAYKIFAGRKKGSVPARP